MTSKQKFVQNILKRGWEGVGELFPIGIAIRSLDKAVVR